MNNLDNSEPLYTDVLKIKTWEDWHSHLGIIDFILMFEEKAFTLVWFNLFYCHVYKI